MLDALVEFVARFVGSAIVEIVFLGIFYWPGWLILRVVTLGRYPPAKGEPHNHEFVAAVAVAALLAAIVVVLGNR